MFKEINLCINDFFFVQNAYMDLMNINGIRSTKWSETLLFNQFEDINTVYTIEPGHCTI